MITFYYITGFWNCATYSKAGTYTAKLKITDNYGEVAIDTVQVTIKTIPPIAGFVYSPSNPYTSDTVVFTDTSTDQDGTISSWSWDFGDGYTSKNMNPTHKYQSAGTYKVKLTIKDNDGASDDSSKSIAVSESSLSNTIKNKISNPAATEKSSSGSTNDDESTPGFTIILGIINIFLIFLVRKKQM